MSGVRGPNRKVGVYGQHYPQVSIGVGGNRCKAIHVHRLVALAFIPNPDDLPQVNHKDGDKTNNHVGNLEWVTHRENGHHAMRTGLTWWVHGESHSCARLTVDKAREIRTRCAAGASHTELANEFGVHRGSIYAIAAGRSWKHA